MSAWSSSPGVLKLVERLRLVALRLERLDLRQRLERERALLQAHRAAVKKTDG
jgi:hypothetical protein